MSPLTKLGGFQSLELNIPNKGRVIQEYIIIVLSVHNAGGWKVWSGVGNSSKPLPLYETLCM